MEERESEFTMEF